MFVMMFSILFMVLFLVECDCRWVSEVGLISYYNKESKAFDNVDTAGQCCDPPSTAGECRDECDTYFTFCLQRVNETGLSSCVYGRYDTSEVGGDELLFEKETTLDSAATPNPLVFSGDEWPDDSTVSFVVFAFDNDTTDYDLVGTATISLKIIVDGAVGQLSVNGPFYKLSMEYKTRCAVGYYGPECGTMCVPRDNSAGHYECDSRGNIICLPGYTGEDNNCTSVEMCVPECTGNAHCNAFNVCVCNEGWSGRECTTPLCEEGCSNGGRCVLPNSCQCVEGWKGSSCRLLSTSQTQDNSSNSGFIIGCVIGAAAFAFAVGIAVSLIIYIKRKHYIHRLSEIPPTNEKPVTLEAVNPGDNPNYSPTSMGSHLNLDHSVDTIGCLDNPLYTKPNSSTDIVAGYSLVSLPEETNVYYSGADEPTKTEKPFYDSIRSTSSFRKVRKPVCYSQPVMNNDSGNEYDHADTRSCVREKTEANGSGNCDEFV